MNNPTDYPLTPEQAVERARAALRIGMTVPQVQELLVAGGLAPATAEAIVIGIVENQVREQFAPLEQEDRSDLLHRVLSGLFAVVCIFLGYEYGGGRSAGKLIVISLFLLACIWFPKVADRYWGGPDAGPVSSKMVRLMAWVVLILIGIYRVVLLINQPV